MDVDLSDVVTAYEQCGADAISILTEKKHFAGSLDDLSSARKSVQLPLLRKDFIVDEYQITEARAFGADAVLLIVALLTPLELRRFIQHAKSHAMEPLVEVHDEAELQSALRAGADIIGVNNRDLKTLEVHLETGERLLSKIPADCIRVAESGMKTAEDVRRMHDSGATAFLIGSALMRSSDMKSKIAELKQL